MSQETDRPRPSGGVTRVRFTLRELGAFGTVGAACFVLDLALFQLLYTVGGTGPVLAKLLSTVTSTSVAFLGHRYWSFSGRARTGLPREYLRFGVINGATLLLGLTVVAVVRYPLGQEHVLVLQAANVASIALGTVIRFVAYRHWVFPAAATAGARVPVPVQSSAPAAR